MFISVPAPLGALCLTLLVIVSPVRADAPDDSGAVANDPVALLSPPAGGEKAESGAGEDGFEAPPREPIASDPTAADLPSPSESMALGLPNGIFSARPQIPAADETSSGALSAFDPRTNEVTRVLAALAAVLGLLLLLRLFVRRAARGPAGGDRPSGVLEILARYPVARGQSLIILKLARRILLVHQSGASMSTLSEITGPDEVASLLARMEAGSDSRRAGKFRAVLRAFESEHERLAARSPAHLVGGQRDAPEIIDLTRSQMKGLGGLLGRRRMSA